MQRRILVIAAASAGIAQVMADHPELFAGDDEMIMGSDFYRTPEPMREIQMRPGREVSTFDFRRNYHRDEHRPRDLYRNKGRRS